MLKIIVPNRYLPWVRDVCLWFIPALFLLSSCDFKVPLTSKHSIGIDQAVLGSWELIAEKGQEADPSGTVTIKVYQFSETEYLIHYFEAGSSYYFRGYPINIEGVEAVQLDLLGSDEELVAKDDEDRFHVASYEWLNGQLVIRTLNSEVVDDDISDSESLRKAFLANKDNPDLFQDPGVFKRL